MTRPSPNPDDANAIPGGLNLMGLLMLVVGFAPLVVAYWIELWQHPWYRFFPIALAGAAALAGRALWQRRAAAQPGQARVWLPLMALAMALLALGALRWSPWLGTIASLVGMVSVSWWCGGGPLTRAFLPALSVLGMVFGPPMWLGMKVMNRAEWLILNEVDRGLYSFLVPHALLKPGMELPMGLIPRSSLFAGLHGLPWLLVVELVFLLWLRRHPLRVAVALGATLLFAMPGEVWRLVWSLSQCDARQSNFFLTLKSDLLVWALWVGCFGLMLSVDQFLTFLTLPRRRSDEPPPAAEPVLLPKPGWRARLGLGTQLSRAGWGLGVTALLLAVGQGFAGWLALSVGKAGFEQGSRLRAGASFAFPQSTEPWFSLPSTQSLARVRLTGRVSQSAHYQNGEVALGLGWDGPWQGVETPTEAMELNRWRVLSVRPVVSATNPEPPCVEVELGRDPMLKAVLWYGWVDEAGRWIEPPKEIGGAEPAAPSLRAAGPTYRAQALLVAARPLSPAERAAAKRLFDEARLALAGQLAQQLSTTQ